MESSLFIPAGSYIQLTYSSTINSANISQTGVASASLGGFKVTGVQYAVTDNIMTPKINAAKTGKSKPSAKSKPSSKPKRSGKTEYYIDR